LGAMQAAQELGWKCPADISIIGFGDAPESGYWRPRLTTFSLSSNRVAAEAIELAIELRRNPGQEAKAVFIPEELLIRDSTGPAPARREAESLSGSK
jgi:DNA-binding LacI/PurR family transcriptional regulator